MDYGTQRVRDLVALLASDEPLPYGTTVETIRESAKQAMAVFERYYQEPNDGNGWRCGTCGTRTKYQGWDNYETWELALEIDNDEYLQEEAYRIVQEAGSTAKAADEMKLWIEDMVDEHLQAQGLKDGIASVPFYSLYRMDSVNWREVADHFKPDYATGDTWESEEEEEDESEEE